MTTLSRLVKAPSHRRLLRLSCLLLAILLVALGVKSVQRGNRARELAAQAVAVSEKDPELSFQLAARAVSLAENDETIGALRRSLQASPTIKVSGSDHFIKSAFFSPDSKWLLVVSYDNFARIWERSSGKLVSQISVQVDDREFLASFSPDSKWLLTNDRYGEAKLCEVPSGRLISEFKARSFDDKESGGRISTAAFSQDGGKVFTIEYEKGIRTWDLPSGRLLSQLPMPPYWYHAFFSPDSKWVVTDGLRNLDDGQLWEVSTWRRVGELPQFTPYASSFKSVAFSPNGKWLAFLGRDYKSRIFEVSTGRQIIEMKRGDSLDVEFSPDGKLFATRTRVFAPWEPQSIIIRELPTGREIKKFDRHPSRVNSLAFSPDSKLVVSASGASTSMAGNQFTYDSYKAEWATLVWEATSGRQIARTENQSKLVTHVAFSPDGKWLVTADEGGVAVIHPFESFAPPETILTLARQRELRKFTEAERGKYGVE
ncbi:MAG: WD40 repeat domain-containing protein [Acidobacteriota bacterium]